MGKEYFRLDCHYPFWQNSVYEYEWLLPRWLIVILVIGILEYALGSVLRLSVFAPTAA